MTTTVWRLLFWALPSLPCHGKRDLLNSMKLWAMPCRTTQDGSYWRVVYLLSYTIIKSVSIAPLPLFSRWFQNYRQEHWKITRRGKKKIRLGWSDFSISLRTFYQIAAKYWKISLLISVNRREITKKFWIKRGPVRKTWLCKNTERPGSPIF